MLKSNSLELIKYKSHFPLLLIIVLPYTFIIGALVLEIVANSIGLYFLYIVFKNLKIVRIIKYCNNKW